MLEKAYAMGIPTAPREVKFVKTKQNAVFVTSVTAPFNKGTVVFPAA